MSLLNTIKQKQLAARKARDQIEISLLTTLIGEASMPGKNDGNRESTDAEVIAVVKKFKKNLEETLKVLKGKSDSIDLQARALQEIMILDSFLPKQMTEEELTLAVQNIINQLADKAAKSAFGSVMKSLKDQYEGMYDGGQASKIIKDLLK